MPAITNNRTVFPPQDKPAPKGAIRVVERQITEDDGSERVQYIWERGHFVMVVPFESSQVLLLKREFKYAIMREMLTFAAGGVKEDESTIAAAERELKKEFGMYAERLQPLCSVSNSPDKSTEIHHVYLALDLHPIPDCIPEPGKIVRVHRSNFDALLSSRHPERLEIALCRLALHEALAHFNIPLTELS